MREQSEDFDQEKQVRIRLLEIWEDRAAVDRFMMTAHPELDGLTPKQAISTPGGPARIAAIIDKGQHGFPA